MISIDHSVQSFNALTPAQLYDILQLRSEVFVVEQNCVYQDMDQLDQIAMHLMAYHENSLVAYARILAPGNKHKEASIGRIVSSPSLRRHGFGRSIVNQAIAYCQVHFQASPIKISAQCYLDEFYTSFGFRKVSEVYLEDGIDHQAMVLEF